MRTGRIIEAGINDQEIVQNLAFHDRLLDDSWYVFDRHLPIPNPLGIDHDGRPMLALIETASAIGSHQRASPDATEFLLKRIAKRGFATGIAGAARMIGSALIATDKQMACKGWHR
jgi:hypothetical protein